MTRTAKVAHVSVRETTLQLGLVRLESLANANPAFAECKAEIVRVFTSLVSPWGQHPLLPQPSWRSDVGDDHTPFEFSIAYGGALPEFRILVEAQAEQPSLQSNWHAAQELTQRLEREHGVDMRRLHAIVDLFEPTDLSAAFGLWHAVSFWPGKHPEFKAYLNLQAHGAARSASVLEEALWRLDLSRAYPYFMNNAVARGAPYDELKYFSLDLTSSEKARTKLYVRHHEATIEQLARVAASASTTTSSDVDAFCRTLLGPGPYSSRAVASCMAFVHESAPSNATLYAPVGYYVRDDAEVAHRLHACFEHFELSSAQLDRDAKSFSNRHMGDGVGLHSYVSFKREEAGPKMTVYFAAEAYETFAPGALSERAQPTLEMWSSVAEMLQYYEGEGAIDKHPLFRRFDRGPVDLGKIWTLLANGEVAVATDFTRWLAHLVARVETDEVRSMLAKQLNDELGNGNPERTHAIMFREMLEVFGTWRNEGELESQRGPGRRMAKGLAELYTQRPAMEAIGVTILMEVFGKQADQRVGGLIRTQEILDARQLTWLVVHEELENEHADEATKIARFAIKSTEDERALMRGARELAALAHRYFDDLYEVLFR